VAVSVLGERRGVGLVIRARLRIRAYGAEQWLALELDPHCGVMLGSGPGRAPRWRALRC